MNIAVLCGRGRRDIHRHRLRGRNNVLVYNMLELHLIVQMDERFISAEEGEAFRLHARRDIATLLLASTQAFDGEEMWVRGA